MKKIGSEKNYGGTVAAMNDHTTAQQGTPS
jgi:hypothetical protein